jgi:hypothetical protein
MNALSTFVMIHATISLGFHNLLNTEGSQVPIASLPYSI